MSDLQRIQNLLKETSELLQEDTKAAKKKAAKKLRQIEGIAATTAVTLELTK